MTYYKALLTDLDGTLVHSEDCICDALVCAFRHVKTRIPDKKEIMDMFGLPVEQMLTTLTDIEVSEKERIDAFIEEYKRQYPIYMAHASLIDGAYETLKTVYNRQIPICLITSERRKNAEYILKQLKLFPMISYIVSRDDVQYFKPHPEPIEKGAEKCRVSERECLYIGESPFDIEAGVRAGVFTVAVASGSWPEESLMACNPDLFVKDISEITKYF